MDVVRDEKGKLHKLSPNHPIPHILEINGKYQIAKPAEQPKLQVEVQVDITTYREFGMADTLQKKFSSLATYRMCSILTLCCQEASLLHLS